MEIRGSGIISIAVSVMLLAAGVGEDEELRSGINATIVAMKCSDEIGPR